MAQTPAMSAPHRRRRRTPPSSNASTPNPGTTYGAPRVHAELADDYNIRCGRKRVARLMRNAGLVGCHRRKKVWTTKRRPAQRRPRLIGSSATSPRLRRTSCGWPTSPTSRHLGRVRLPGHGARRVLHAAFVGWSYANHMRTSLIVDAVDMAVEQRKPAPGLVHHSDQGTQYTSIEFRPPLPPSRHRPVDGICWRLFR